MTITDVSPRVGGPQDYVVTVRGQNFLRLPYYQVRLTTIHDVLRHCTSVPMHWLINA